MILVTTDYGLCRSQAKALDECSYAFEDLADLLRCRVLAYRDNNGKAVVHGFLQQLREGERKPRGHSPGTANSNLTGSRALPPGKCEMGGAGVVRNGGSLAVAA